MKEYTFEIIEKMTSIVRVDADSREEAYEKAMEELKDGFEAPYHTDIYVEDWDVINERELEE